MPSGPSTNYKYQMQLATIQIATLDLHYIKLHQFNPNIPDNCIKCSEEFGTMFHCV